MAQAQHADFPRIDTVGLDGVLVRFGDTLEERANRAALAFRAALEQQSPDGVEECSTSLVSAYLRFDPLAVPLDVIRADLQALLASRDWYAEPLPQGRRFFRIPTCYDATLAPQLEEAASMVGLSPEAAIADLAAARVRVTALGFAPGQPYLGTLAEIWDIPRQTALTPQVPSGALVLAIRQFVLFANPAPTGWRHVGQTAAPLFDPTRKDPFLLRPGDEVQFHNVSLSDFGAFQKDPQGGAVSEPVG